MPIAPKTFGYKCAPNGVATLTFERPDKLNSLTFAVYREMADVLEAMEEHEEIRSVVVTGEGRAFCSGGDVNDIIGELFARDMKGLVAFTRATGRLIANIRKLRRPVVAAVNGVAVGAGAVIALACDFRIASDTASFGFLFPKVGLCGADMGAGWLLPRVVGLARASELLFLGDRIDAARAEQIGLVNRVVPAADLLGEAVALARQISANSSAGVRMSKRALQRNLEVASYGAALELENRGQALLAHVGTP